MKIDKKFIEKSVWGIVGALTLVAGAVHVFPTQPFLVGLVSATPLSPTTVQMVAGVSAAIAGVMILGKALGKG